MFDYFQVQKYGRTFVQLRTYSEVNTQTTCHDLCTRCIVLLCRATLTKCPSACPRKESEHREHNSAVLFQLRRSLRSTSNLNRHVVPPTRPTDGQVLASSIKRLTDRPTNQPNNNPCKHTSEYNGVTPSLRHSVTASPSHFTTSPFPPLRRRLRH